MFSNNLTRRPGRIQMVLQQQDMTIGPKPPFKVYGIGMDIKIGLVCLALMVAMGMGSFLYGKFIKPDYALPLSDPYYPAVNEFIKGNADPLYNLARIESLGSRESFRNYCRQMISRRNNLHIQSGSFDRTKRIFGLSSDRPGSDRLEFTYWSNGKIKNLIYWDHGEFSQYYPKNADPLNYLGRDQATGKH